MNGVKLAIVVLACVFMMSVLAPTGASLDVSCRAIKARESKEYSPDTAWELNYTGKGVVIVMIDSGIDDEHESLRGKFVAGVDVRKPWTPQDGSYNPDDNAGHGTYTAGIGVGIGDRYGSYKVIAPGAKFVDVCMGSLRMSHHLVESVEWCIEHKDTEWEDQPPEYYGIDIIWLMVGDSEPEGELAQVINKAVDSGMVVVQVMGNAGPDNSENAVCAVQIK